MQVLKRSKMVFMRAHYQNFFTLPSKEIGSLADILELFIGMAWMFRSILLKHLNGLIKLLT
jgi:hypothetical protein